MRPEDAGGLGAGAVIRALIFAFYLSEYYDSCIPLTANRHPPSSSKCLLYVLLGPKAELDYRLRSARNAFSSTTTRPFVGKAGRQAGSRPSERASEQAELAAGEALSALLLFVWAFFSLSPSLSAAAPCPCLLALSLSLSQSCDACSFVGKDCTHVLVPVGEF